MSRRSLQTERRRETTAYHEAGHVVAMYWLHLPITSATIIPDERSDSLGHVRGPRPKSFRPVRQDRQTRDRIEKEIIASLAGYIAEKKRIGRANPAAADEIQRAADLAFCRFGDRDVVGAYLQYLNLLARRNVARWWPAIEVVAVALLERETLSGRQLRGILREARRRELSLARVTAP